MSGHEFNQQLMIARELPKQSAALVLAGGRGSRLKDLTITRAKPAVFFGGKYRIIDFALSNCINSGIAKIGVLTQYRSHSLIQHIQRGWSFTNMHSKNIIDLLPAQQRTEEGVEWYRGTADAIFQNLDIIRLYHAKYIVILAGDHVYKMDYSRMLLDHYEKKSQCTIACITIPKEIAHEFGVMEIDDTGKIQAFVEKSSQAPTIPNQPDYCLASMGIYVFNADYLYKLLEQDALDPNSSHDFGKNIIPKVVNDQRAWSHPFELSCVMSNASTGVYWRDVGTVYAYWQANLDLASVVPELDIYDTQWPIHSYIDAQPSAKFVQDQLGKHGMTINSLVSAGCIISGSHIMNSVLYNRVRVNSFCYLNESVILPETQIGRHCRLSRCIIDRACVLPQGLVIGEDPVLDAKRFYRSEEGIVLVTRDMLKGLTV